MLSCWKVYFPRKTLNFRGKTKTKVEKVKNVKKIRHVGPLLC